MSRWVIEAAEDRFMRFVSPEPNTGCWLWTGGMRSDGYGVFYLDPDHLTYAAHRAALRLFKGEFDERQCACHRCDNPACVNPDHLFLGTLQDNMRDMSAKGRARFSSITHCVNGHPLSGPNARVRGGDRICRTCERVRAARYRTRRRTGVSP